MPVVSNIDSETNLQPISTVGLQIVPEEKKVVSEYDILSNKDLLERVKRLLEAED